MADQQNYQGKQVPFGCFCLFQTEYFGKEGEVPKSKS